MKLCCSHRKHFHWCWWRPWTSLHLVQAAGGDGQMLQCCRLRLRHADTEVSRCHGSLTISLSTPWHTGANCLAVIGKHTAPWDWGNIYLDQMATFSNYFMKQSHFEGEYNSKDRTDNFYSSTVVTGPHLQRCPRVQWVVAPGLASEVLSKLSGPCLVLLTYSRLAASVSHNSDGILISIYLNT